MKTTTITGGNQTERNSSSLSVPEIKGKFPFENTNNRPE